MLILLPGLCLDHGKLSGSTVASSFGKLVTKENPREGVREEDLALALLMMITNNIGQVAYLTAQLQNCSKIYFVGSFLRQNLISCRRLAYAIGFWSGGKMEALFLMHEGYFGALGTFLQSAFGEDVDRIININNLNIRKVPSAAELAAVAAETLGMSKVSNNHTERSFPIEKSKSADDSVSNKTKLNEIPLSKNGILYFDDSQAFARGRSLRGRSFSDDYGSRATATRERSLSPKQTSPEVNSQYDTSSKSPRKSMQNQI
jgi:hypothetical protein